jgi:hypothetical protein
VREKLNNNPVYQAVFLGVLALGVALMLLMRMGGGAEEPAPDAAATPPTGTATTVVGGTGVTTTPATDPAATATTPAADPAATAAATAPAGGPTDFKAGPGLPAPLADAYDGGQAVALLIVNRKGLDDRDLEQTVRSVGARSDVAVFTTDVKNVADYSRITEGVKVNRTPVLVVIQPRRLAAGPMPAATASYGFRGPASVQQAFDDALYDGPSGLPYYP